MNALLRSALALAGIAIATPALAQITFYEHDGFQGRHFTSDGLVGDFTRYGFNDRASSVQVLRDQWLVCDDAHFQGRCVVLLPGNYPSLSAMGLNDRVSSARAVGGNARIDDPRYAPAPPPAYDYRRRRNERLYEAQVTSVRAVVGPPEQRCWVEEERFAADRSNANVPGAIAGAIIGGILGHQIGSGRGQDLATAGGVIAGAAVGANIGNDGDDRQPYSRNVQRCAEVPRQGRPDFWDVTYHFRGEEHRVQMTYHPGPTVRVNRRGEPRE